MDNKEIREVIEKLARIVILDDLKNEPYPSSGEEEEAADKLFEKSINDFIKKYPSGDDGILEKLVSGEGWFFSKLIEEDSLTKEVKQELLLVIESEILKKPKEFLFNKYPVSLLRG